MVTEKCKHNWVPANDGTLNLLCRKCGVKAKQAVSFMPSNNLTLPIAAPVMQPIRIKETGIGFEEIAYKQRNIF